MIMFVTFDIITVLPGAEHALRNAEGVFILAGALVNNWHIHLHQLHWAAGAAFIILLLSNFITSFSDLT